MKEEWTEADDVIEEAREIRRRISARFDDDPVKLVEHYVEVQKQYAERLIEAPPKRDRKGKPAA